MLDKLSDEAATELAELEQCLKEISNLDTSQLTLNDKYEIISALDRLLDRLSPFLDLVDEDHDGRVSKIRKMLQ